MKRLLLLCGAGLFLLTVAIVSYFVLKAPSATDYGLARGRSLLDSENYLAALETLRTLPANPRSKADTDTLLGTAYLRLHLYLAAIKEFEDAEKQGARRPDPWLGLAASYIQLGDGQKAQDEANHAVRMNAKSVDAWVLLSRAYLIQQNFPEAEKAALKAQQLDPDQPTVSEMLLHIYFEDGVPDKFQTAFDHIKNPSKGTQDLAVQFYVRQGQWLKAYETQTRFEREADQAAIFETELALKREPGRMDLYPALIRNLVKDGRYDETIAAAGRYKGPISIDLEVGKGLWMTGRKDAAILAFQRASADLVHKLSAEVALATLTGDSKHWREAYKAEHPEQDYFILGKLEAALQAAPPSFLAFAYRYAGIYDSLFYTKAADQSLKALEDEPKNLDAFLTLGTAYQRLGKAKDAVRYVEQAAELYPKDAEPWARLASLSLGDKDSNKTLSLMIKAVQLDPHNSGNLYNLAWMFDQLGDVPKAIDLYEQSIKASPLSFEAMDNLALIYEQNGQSDRSLELLQRAIQLDPEIEIGYFNLANHYVRQREWREALQAYDQVLELNPADSSAAVEKGKIHIEIGQNEAAVEDLNRALESDAHSFEAYLLLSSAYEKMNRFKEAIAAAEEAQRIRADEPEVKAALDRLRSQGGKEK